MATVIRADGRIEEVDPADGRYFSLRELQAIIGGYIEVIYHLDDGRFMYLNEDGKRLGLPLNHEATARVRHRLVPGDVIVGDVVLCTRAETGDEEADDDPR